MILISPGLYFPFFVLIDSKSTRFWINCYTFAAISFCGQLVSTPLQIQNLPPSPCSKSPAVVFLDRGERGKGGNGFWRSVLDLKGCGNDLKWPQKCSNWLKSGLTLNQFLQIMGNITLAILIALIVKSVKYHLVKKKFCYSRSRVQKNLFWNTQTRSLILVFYNLNE